MHFVCFLLFWESFNCCNYGTTGPIQVGFSAKCTSPNEEFIQFIQKENWKCYMFDFRLIPVDRNIFFIRPHLSGIRSMLSGCRLSSTTCIGSLSSWKDKNKYHNVLEKLIFGCRFYTLMCPHECQLKLYIKSVIPTFVWSHLIRLDFGYFVLIW